VFLFGLKSKNDYKTFDDLKNKKIAISKDIFYKNFLIENGIDVVEVKGSSEKAKLLALQKVDYFLASFTNGTKAITKLGLTNIKAIDEIKGIKKEDLRGALVLYFHYLSQRKTFQSF
jgi:ABC-type amino acid transport substrate-binding protein